LQNSEVSSLAKRLKKKLRKEAKKKKQGTETDPDDTSTTVESSV